MDLIRYFKEFYYGLASITVLLAATCAGLALLIAPLLLTVYLGDVLNLHDAIAFSAAILVYSMYWAIARHYKWIEIR
jgi:hypothetical protein